ncbi:hypothetical protein FRC09_009650 [Ceratobasidium sp. 395]|nr:hypothetical protein FRC09_009650 [Ceratobasidium sp. 395]
MEAGFSIESALNQWKSMRVQLSSSIQSYVSACKTLGVVCVRDHQTRTRATVEQVLTLLDAELESLTAEENTLRASRFSLSTVRNRSETLAPINLLPPEILNRIFTLSVSNCVHYGYYTFPYNFANTCEHWRQLALNTPYFWTHIDIGPSVPWKLSKLMLERANLNPMYLHITGSQSYDWENPEHEISYYPALLLDDLKSHMRRVHTLGISSQESGANFVRSITKLWLEHGDRNLVQLLSVYQNSGKEVLFDGPQEDEDEDEEDEGDTEINISEHGKDVLLSLEALQLHGTRFSWDSNAYRGLVDLQLGFSNGSRIASVSSLELVSILMASPMLTVLKLKGLDITRTKSLAQAIPIPLNHLRILNLTEMPTVSLAQLLPLIALPRSSSTELSVGVGVCSGLEKELKDFLGQSPITTLYCLCRSSDFGAWSSILVALDSLQTLILDMNTFGLRDNVSLSQVDTNPRQAPCSRPISLFLKRCCPLPENINDIVSKLGIHNLQIKAPAYIKDYGIKQPGEVYWQSIKTSLMQAFPNLRYTLDQYSMKNPHEDISPE